MNDVYLMAPNYAAGKDMMTGFKRFFKGKIAAEVYTKFGQSGLPGRDQPDPRRQPEGGVRLPARRHGHPVRQAIRAGRPARARSRSTRPSPSTRRPCRRSATPPIGNYEVGFWSPDLDNPRNKEFVAAFRKKFGYMPSFYGAQSYDAITMIDSRRRRGQGRPRRTRRRMIAALRKADFKSCAASSSTTTTTSRSRTSTCCSIGKDADGEFVRKIQKTVFENHKDAYYRECQMKW